MLPSYRVRWLRQFVFAAILMTVSGSSLFGGPTITGHSPTRNLIAPGASFTLFVGATGTGGVTCQWMHKGRAIPGATNTSLTIANAAYSDAGAYWAILTDQTGSTSSAPIFVLVAPTATELRGAGSSAFGQTLIPSGLDAIAITAGSQHAAALKRDGSLAVWGRSNVHQTSNVPGGQNFVAVASSGSANHTLALKQDGTVVAWGWNEHGQLNVPPGLTNVVAIAAGAYQSLALKNDGTVVAWGSSFYGATTPPLSLHSVIGIAGGAENSFALNSDGTVVSWGSATWGVDTIPAAAAGVSEITSGTWSALALKANGTVVSWGYLAYGLPPENLGNVRRVSSGAYHALALKSDGTVVAWGENSFGQATVPSDLTDVFAIAGGGEFSLFLRSTLSDVAPAIVSHPVAQTVSAESKVTFTVTTSGHPSPSFQWRKDGVDIVGATSASLVLREVAVSDAGDYTVVITNAAGSVTSNPARLLVRPLPVVTATTAARLVLAPGESLSLSASATGTGSLHYQWFHDGYPIAGATGLTYTKHSTTLADKGAYWLAVTDDNGTKRSSPFFAVVAPIQTRIVAWGSNTNGEISGASGKGDVIELAGIHFVLGLRRNGEVAVWGNDSDNYSISNPPTLTNAVAVTAGNGAGGALLADGTVTAWGSNELLKAIPPGLKDVVAVSFGADHALALKSDGAVIAWGDNYHQQCVVPDNLSNVVKVIASPGYSIAIRADGSIVTWGSAGVAGPPPGSIGPVTSVVLGGMHGVALKADGTVAAWGYPFHGYTNVPTGLGSVTTISVGGDHSLTLRSNGTVATWGPGTAGALRVPSDLAGVFAIAAIRGTSFAIQGDSGGTTPILTTQPSNRTVHPDRDVEFSVAALVTAGVTYRWQANTGSGWYNLDDSDQWSGTNTETLTIAGWAASPLHGVQFRCVLSNAHGTTTTDSATLIVRHSVPSTGDFNHDGRTDLLWRHTATGQIATWLMDGTLFAGSVSLNSISLDWQSGGAGDFNGDEHTDLLWRSLTTGEVVVWFMNGSTFTGASSLGYVSLDWQSIGTGDFNHDGHVDLLWRSVSTGQVAVWYMDGITFAGSASVGYVAKDWRDAGTGDFNQDGHTDLLWRSASTGQVAVWFMDRITFAGSASLGYVSTAWKNAGSGDFNHDGHTDLLWRHKTNGEIAVWFFDRINFAGSASVGSLAPEWQQ